MVSVSCASSCVLGARYILQAGHLLSAVHLILFILHAESTCSFFVFYCSLMAEDDVDCTFVQCAAQLSTLYSVMAQGTDPKRWTSGEYSEIE